MGKDRPTIIHASSTTTRLLQALRRSHEPIQARAAARIEGLLDEIKRLTARLDATEADRAAALRALARAKQAVRRVTAVLEVILALRVARPRAHPSTEASHAAIPSRWG